ncbi:MAG: Fumarate reductase flavoprotein subunit [Chlamydiia bacterium]|nr:Fumarate reductase flavoprotein subunit [Chlamydiia bacterium]
MEQKRQVIVIGGGLAGLAATMKLAEQGVHVVLLSVTPVKRSHSVCAQGGINSFQKDVGDSFEFHAYDTIKGGDFLIDQQAVLEMCYAAPKIIDMFDRMGCPFNRTKEGTLDVRRFGGTLHKRTTFCGASTGQQLLYALDEQVRRYEVEGLVEKYEFHEFIRVVQDENHQAIGVVVLNHRTMKFESFRGDAVVNATGGCGMIFGKSTNSTFCTGAANGRLYMQGACYANGEFIQIHPSAIKGQDKCRLISESVRGEGGRVWVYGDSSKEILFPDGSTHPCGETGKPWYFLEEMYPVFKNLVPRDIGARECLRVCKLGLGIDGEYQVHLDVTHLPPATHHKLEAVLDIYHKFTGEDPRKVPMRIFPAVHYTMGGLHVDYPDEEGMKAGRYKHMTNLLGVFCVGEADYHYHGANRLGANSLLACVFSGLVAGLEVNRFLDAKQEASFQMPDHFYLEAIALEEAKKQEILARKGEENIFKLLDEMGEMMLLNVTVERNNDSLQQTLNALKGIRARLDQVELDDKSEVLNKSLIVALQARPMIELAILITKGALERNESRGAHFKPEFPERDDNNWLCHTMGMYHPDEPILTYREVDTCYIEPVLRDYSKGKATLPKFKNLPDKIACPL